MTQAQIYQAGSDETIDTQHEPAVLIVNTKARNGQDNFNRAVAGLQHAGINLTGTYPLNDCTKLPDLLKDLTERGVKTVIIGGGDGTLSCVVDQLSSKDITLGVLPLGTANDFATTLNIPTSIEEACQVIANGRIHRVDLGIANNICYLNVASVGFGAAVAASVTNDDKKTLGPLAYAFSAAETALTNKPFKARLTFSNQIVETEAIHIAVANGRLYGGGNVVTSDARLDDRELIVVIFEPMGPPDMVQIGLHLRDGAYVRNPHVRVFRRVQHLKLEISGNRQQRLNIDGEIKTHTPVEFKIAPAALKVIVP